MSDEWLGVVFAVPMYVTDETLPYRPEALLWFDLGTAEVVGCRLTRPDDVLAAASESFLEATASPMRGAPRKPTRVRVADETLAGALRAGVQDVEVVVAPTPELEPVIEIVLEEMLAGQAEERVLVDGDTTTEDVGAFFDAAARMFEARVWEKVPLGSFVQVRCPAIVLERGALFIVGQAEPPAGFSLFWSDDDVARYAASAEAEERGEPSDLPEHLVLSFGRKDEAPAGIAREAAENSFRIAADDAFPNAMIVDEDIVGRPLTTIEMRAVTVIMESLIQLAADPELAQAWDGGSAVTAARAQAGVAVELTAPMADIDIGPSALQARAERFIERAAEAMTNDEHVAWASLLTDYAVQRHEVLLQELSTEEMSALIFDAIPADVPCAPEQAGDVIEGIRAVLAYASASSEPGRARQLMQWIPKDAAKRLEARLGDPQYFGAEKLVLMAGAWAGYDMSSEEGIAQFLATTQMTAEEVARKARANFDAMKKKR